MGADGRGMLPPTTSYLQRPLVGGWSENRFQVPLGIPEVAKWSWAEAKPGRGRHRAGDKCPSGGHEDPNSTEHGTRRELRGPFL